MLVQVPWQINVRISSKRAVSTVYSPSHQVETVRSAPGELSVRLAEQARTDPGSFRLSCLLDDGPLSASLLAYPDAKAGGGTFLLLTGLGNAAASAPAAATQPAAVLNRELTIVLDRSGSMHGEKIIQVRNAALQVLAGLGEGDWFNLITYNDRATPLYAAPQPWSTAAIDQAKACLAGVTPSGGTNIHDALVEALRPPVGTGRIPLVLFLTDGQPTVGVTFETGIREAAARANTSQRRIFTFGVGYDVNVPLLERIASQSRATATFVQPREDVEVKVSQVFSKLAGPRLANLRLEVVGQDGTSAAGRVSDLLPEALPDLYEGDQLVLLGHYRGEQPLSFRIHGQAGGGPRTFQFTFAMDKATTRNAFVPRLWASRRVGQLVDLIRQSGAGVASSVMALTPPPRELVDEVVRLSSEYGILTEYTAFLALEGTDLSKRDAVLATAGQNFAQRGMAVRTGAGAFNQAFNTSFMVQQAALNGRNRYQDQNLQSVEVSGIQQMNDRAFYHRSGRWVDGRLIQKTDPAAGAREVEFGSIEYDRLAGRMAAEHRAGVMALRGEILTEVDDQPVLIKGP